MTHCQNFLVRSSYPPLSSREGLGVSFVLKQISSPLVKGEMPEGQRGFWQ